MKNIFCPTDFSEQANHSVEACYYLAKKFGAEFHLFHVIESENEMTVYELEGTADGMEYEIEVTADGRILEVEEDD